MRFGVREICDVVLKAKAPTKIGNKVFYKNEPVIYFDSLKTSSMEGAATTVYAQGGRGNSRLIAWEGERTVTFTMEDALISPEGFMILSGAGLVEAGNEIVQKGYKTGVATVESSSGGKAWTINVNGSLPKDTTKAIVYLEGSAYPASAASGSLSEADTLTIAEVDYSGGEDSLAVNIYYEVAGGSSTIKVHTTERVEVVDANNIYVSQKPYVNGSEDLIYVMVTDSNGDVNTEPYIYTYKGEDKTKEGYHITLKRTNEQFPPKTGDSYVVLVDYYTEKTSGARQIEITADKFGGNYYLEASTLFRDTNGVDMPAEFIIPNCKIQSNFTFTMASSGDPSTFTFTMDAFPDYTRFDGTKKVLSVIQIISEEDETNALSRTSTAHTWDENHENYFNR